MDGRERRRMRETRGGAPVGEAGAHERRAERARDGRDVGPETVAPVPEARRVRIRARREHEVRADGTHAAVRPRIIVAAAEETFEEVERAPERRAARTIRRRAGRQRRIVSHDRHAVREGRDHEPLRRQARGVDSERVRTRATPHEDHGARGGGTPARARVRDIDLRARAEADFAPQRADGLADRLVLEAGRRAALRRAVPHEDEPRHAALYERDGRVRGRRQRRDGVQGRLREGIAADGRHRQSGEKTRQTFFHGDSVPHSPFPRKQIPIAKWGVKSVYFPALSFTKGEIQE